MIKEALRESTGFEVFKHHGDSPCAAHNGRAAASRAGGERRHCGPPQASACLAFGSQDMTAEDGAEEDVCQANRGRSPNPKNHARGDVVGGAGIPFGLLCQSVLN